MVLSRLHLCHCSHLLIAVLLPGRFGILEGEFLLLSILVEGSVSIQHSLLLNQFGSDFEFLLPESS